MKSLSKFINEAVIKESIYDNNYKEFIKFISDSKLANDLVKKYKDNEEIVRAFIEYLCTPDVKEFLIDACEDEDNPDFFETAFMFLWDTDAELPTEFCEEYEDEHGVEIDCDTVYEISRDIAEKMGKKFKLK